MLWISNSLTVLTIKLPKLTTLEGPTYLEMSLIKSIQVTFYEYLYLLFRIAQDGCTIHWSCKAATYSMYFSASVKPLDGDTFIVYSGGMSDSEETVETYNMQKN